MKPIRFLVLTFLICTGFLQQGRCQRLVRDSAGNYYYNKLTLTGSYRLKPVDSGSCKFYYLKWKDTYHRYKDSLPCATKNKLFLNVDAYMYQSYLSQKNFIYDIEGHANADIRLSLEYYFIPNLGVEVGLEDMRFKNSGYIPSSTAQFDTDKIVYQCTTIPILLKYRVPASNMVSFHVSAGILPSFVDYEKIRYYSADSAALHTVNTKYYYYISTGVQKVISMYECAAGLSFSGPQERIKFNVDYTLTWANLPYYYHYDAADNESQPQRFSARGIKMGVSFDLGRRLDKDYRTHVKNFKKDYFLHHPKPPVCG